MVSKTLTKRRGLRGVDRPSPMVNSSWSFRFLAASVVMVLVGDRLMRSLSLDLIHRFAWPCGSTINGNRDDRVTMIPFCTERSSEGSPSSDHSPIVPGKARRAEPYIDRNGTF